MTLTDLQRHALYLSSLKGGALVVRKRTSGGKHVTTRQANVLERKGLVTRHEDILLITKEGRRELNAVLPEDPPVYARHRTAAST
jgi:ribosomal protein S19E (S16A)